jgi:hypothetical protein
VNKGAKKSNRAPAQASFRKFQSFIIGRKDRIEVHSSLQPSLEAPSTPKFSVDDVLKYQRRFEEGYNVPDAHYEAWLSMYHPEALSRFQPSSPDLLSLPFYLPPSSSIETESGVRKGKRICNSGKGNCNWLPWPIARQLLVTVMK